MSDNELVQFTASRIEHDCKIATSIAPDEVTKKETQIALRKSTAMKETGKSE